MPKTTEAKNIEWDVAMATSKIELRKAFIDLYGTDNITLLKTKLARRLASLSRN